MSDNGVPPAFSATLCDPDILFNMLHGFYDKERPQAIFIVSPNGLRVTCKHSDSMQVSIFLQMHLFESFDLRQPKIRSKGNIETLLTWVKNNIGGGGDDDAGNSPNDFVDALSSSSDNEGPRLKLTIQAEDSSIKFEVIEEEDVAAMLELSSEGNGFCLFPHLPPTLITGRISVPQADALTTMTITTSGFLTSLKYHSVTDLDGAYAFTEYLILARAKFDLEVEQPEAATQIGP